MTGFLITTLALALVFKGIQVWGETIEEKKRVSSLLVAQAKTAIDALADLCEKTNDYGAYISKGKTDEVYREYSYYIDNVLELMYQLVESTCGKSYVKRAYEEINALDFEMDWVRKIIISKPLTKDEKETYSIKD